MLFAYLSAWSLVSFAGFRACLIHMCLNVWSFLLFCLFIIIFIFILNYVLIVTFWIFIYHEIWTLLNIFLYGTIKLFILWYVWRYSGVLWVNSCPPLTRAHQAVMHEWALLHHWLCNQKHPWGICSCSLIVKPASNDFGCICKQIWKEQFCMKAYITINRTKLYCPKLCMKLIITMKNFFTFVMPLKWAAIIGYM